ALHHRSAAWAPGWISRADVRGGDSAGGARRGHRTSSGAARPWSSRGRAELAGNAARRGRTGLRAGASPGGASGSRGRTAGVERNRAGAGRAGGGDHAGAIARALRREPRPRGWHHRRGPPCAVAVADPRGLTLLIRAATLL